MNEYRFVLLLVMDANPYCRCLTRLLGGYRECQQDLLYGCAPVSTEPSLELPIATLHRSAPSKRKNLASVLCDVATIFSCQRTGGTEVPYLLRELEAPRARSPRVTSEMWSQLNAPPLLARRRRSQPLARPRNRARNPLRGQNVQWS